MRIAVTGGSGHIGTYVCNKLAQAGHDVASLDLKAPEADVRVVNGDLFNLEQEQDAGVRSSSGSLHDR